MYYLPFQITIFYYRHLRNPMPGALIHKVYTVDFLLTFALLNGITMTINHTFHTKHILIKIN